MGTLSGGNKQRVNIAIGLLAEPEVLLLDEPSAALDPRQRSRLWEFILRLAGEGTTVIYATHNIQEADRYASQLIVLADGERLFDGAPRELEREVGTTGPRLRGGVRGVPPRAGPLMRWLLLKDLQILRRSPLLVALLVLYPIVIAVLIGFALSRGPDKPEVAFYNGLEGQSAVVELGGERIDLAEQGQRLFDAIEPVRVDSREEAIQKVRDGEVLGALIIPDDLATNIQSSLEPGTVEVFFNAEDPAKRQYVENTIKAQVQSANAALTKRVAEEALQLLDLISTGGDYTLPGADLRRARPRARGGDPRTGARASCRRDRRSARSSTA